MRLFDYTLLKNRTWSSEILSSLAQIRDYTGKQEPALRQKSAGFRRLAEIAAIQSTESSNRIEGIVTTGPRLQKLVEKKTPPRSRDEEQILGYSRILELIHENYPVIPLTPNLILQLHKEHLKYTDFTYGGRFRNAPAEIDTVTASGEKTVLFRPVEPYETPEAVQRICDSFRRAREQEAIDALLLIPVFILDFLCIHPFIDGNGRMSRLLTLLLLYQSGCFAGRYVSIEKSMEDMKEEYYEALARADRYWHERKNDPEPFVRYILARILSCCRDFAKRASQTDERTGGTAAAL